MPEPLDDMVDELCALRRALWGLEQELKAAAAIQWSPSPLTGISVFDPPGVALEERRLAVRGSVQRASKLVRDMTVRASHARFELLRAQGGWIGNATKDQ